MRSCNTLGDYDIRVFRSSEEIKAAKEVLEPFQKHPSSDIDLYLATLGASSEELEPYLVLLSREEEPAAMLVGQVGTFEFPISIGYLSLFRPKLRALTVFPGAIQGDLSEEFSSTLLDAMLELCAGREVDIVRLVDVPATSTLASLAMRRPSWMCRDHVRWSGRHWKIILPDSSDAFFRRMKEKHRRPLRKACRLIEQENPEGLSYKVFTRPVQIDQFCHEAEHIAQRTYQRRIGASFIKTKATLEKLRFLAERGQWRAYILYVEGCPVAYWVGTQYKRTFHLEYTGRDPSYNQFNPGTGTTLFMKMMEDLCDNTDVREVDFGFGDYPYKRRFGDESEPTVTLLIFAPTLFGISVNMIRTALFWAERSTSFILERIGLRLRLKRFWRDRLGGEG